MHIYNCHYDKGNSPTSIIGYENEDNVPKALADEVIVDVVCCTVHMTAMSSSSGSTYSLYEPYYFVTSHEEDEFVPGMLGHGEEANQLTQRRADT